MSNMFADNGKYVIIAALDADFRREVIIEFFKFITAFWKYKLVNVKSRNYY